MGEGRHEAGKHKRDMHPLAKKQHKKGTIYGHKQRIIARLLNRKTSK